MELIKIDTEQDGKKTVNARDLHKFLEVGRDFPSWIKSRIAQYEFEKGSDFIVLHKTGENGGRPLEEYHLTLDMAKELSMVERNEKGKQARKYFIECEKKVLVPLTQTELILKSAQALVETERKQKELENRLEVIEAKQITSQVNFFTVAGYCSMKRIQVSQLQAAELGRKCAKLSRQKDCRIETIPDARFGKVNVYSVDILQDIVC